MAPPGKGSENIFQSRELIDEEYDEEKKTPLDQSKLGSIYNN